MKLLKVLHLEDSASDALFIRRAVERSGYLTEWNLAGSSAEFKAGLEQGGLDLILVDHGVPGFSGVVALDAARRLRPEVPFIFISGSASESQVMAGINAGATDYVVKDHLWQLLITLRRLFGNSAPAHKSGEAHDSKHDQAMHRLLEVVQELSLARNLETIRAIVRRAARELTGADGATFVLRDGDKCHYFDEDAIAPLWKGQRFPLSACISGWAMLNKQAAVIPDIYVDPRIPVDAYRPTFVKSLVMVPIRPSSPIGAIGNYWATPHHATPEEVELLQALANTTAVAMENAQVYTELEQRVADRTLQLQAANHELEAFSYSVSHDLRAPLRSISGHAGMLKESLGSGLQSSDQRHMDRIQEETRHMAGLIDDLLRLAQFSRIELQHEQVPLSQIAQRLAARLQAGEPQRQVKLVIQPDLVAGGDAGLLNVVLENLLSNAWKYSGKREDAVIQFGSQLQADGSTAYFVRDNGAGFDMQQAGNLFTPFQRLHRTEEFAGNGVGLATVQRIIHRHGGRIWAEAEPGKGATFFFTLSPPVAARPE